jgi:GTPase-associated system helical domain
MNSAVEHMGVLYGKLGLSTSPDLIKSRGAGVTAAGEELTLNHLPDLLRCTFGLGTADERLPCHEHFLAQDPTFDVRQKEQEAALLCASILSYAMQERSSLSHKIALILVAASFGGLRRPTADEALASLAEEILAEAQSARTKAPEPRTYVKAPKSLADAVNGLSSEGAADAGQVRLALVEAVKYADARAQAAAISDNAVLDYAKRLEEELRTYWWVVSGWSNDRKIALRDFSLIEAALRIGKELSDKTTLPQGIFAAPALCDIALRSGRSEIDTPTDLATAATTIEIAERKQFLVALDDPALSPLFPLAAAMKLSAESNDDPDWQPRFKRLTAIEPTAIVKPMQLAIQAYREALAARLLA